MILSGLAALVWVMVLGRALMLLLHHSSRSAVARVRVND